MQADVVCSACKEIFTLTFKPWLVSKDMPTVSSLRYKEFGGVVVDEVALSDMIAEGVGKCDCCGARHYVPELYDPIDLALEEWRETPGG